MNVNQSSMEFWDKSLKQAIHLNASDIHLEPQRVNSQIRIRLAGELRLLSVYPREWHEQLTTKIKLEAKLDISECRIPQDGHMRLSENPAIDCRVATLPTLHGEKFTLRLLQQHHSFDFNDIGLSDKQQEQILAMLIKETGIILISGPTGSGKTRTLFTYLQYLHQLGRNIYTIEDPVEIEMPGIHQVSVNPKAGIRFDNGLKALLRHDPDVIMIGEIRDVETAKIAFQAAQTGHLVLASLHANSALQCLMRLRYMGISNDLLSQTLLGLCGQRLIRKICPDCKEFPSEDCPCRKTGYVERLAIHEIVTITKSMRQAIESNVPWSDLERLQDISTYQSLPAQMSDLIQQGIIDSKEMERLLI